MLHVLRKCKATKTNMQTDEFIGKEGKDLEVMKRIEKERGSRGKNIGKRINMEIGIRSVLFS